MKQTWRIVAVTLLLVTLCTRCSTMDGPEAAAKNNFSEWAVNIRIPYRNENFETIRNDGTLATVRITVELKIRGEWKEKQIEIQCEKADDNWQCVRSFQFKPVTQCRKILQAQDLRLILRTQWKSLVTHMEYA